MAVHRRPWEREIGVGCWAEEAQRKSRRLWGGVAMERGRGGGGVWRWLLLAAGGWRAPAVAGRLPRLAS